MRGKADLFNLIQKMSRSEKRYFTLDAQKGGSKGSKYLKLFQAINGMDEYDETKLKKKFPKNLSADKSYLYDAILRSMRDYRSSKSYAAQIKEKLLDFRYLHELGLYDQCEERLREAKELAEELGSTNALLEINYEERRLSYDRRTKEYSAEVEQLSLERREFLRNISDEQLLLDIYDWLLLYTIKHVEIRRDKAKNELVAAFAEKLKPLQLKVVQLSPRAQHRYYQCFALYNQLLRNYEKTYYYFHKAVDWWEDNPKYKEEEFYYYVLEVANLVHSCFLLEKFDEVSALLEILEDSPLEHFHGSKITRQKIINYRLMYFINTGDLKKAPSFMEKVSNDIEDLKLSTSGRLAIFFNISTLLFIMEDYAQCLNWTNEIIKNIKTELRQDIQKSTRILNLLANYELGNWDKLDLIIRAYSRYYNEKTDINKSDFEYRILSFGKKLISVVQEKELLIELKGYLQTVKENNNENIPLGLDDLLNFWVDSKLEKTSISERIAAKSNLSLKI